MTTGRPPKKITPVNPGPVPNEAAEAQALGAAQTLHQITLATAQAQSDERDLLNQLLGQAQMADAFAKFSKTVFISKLAYVKENKLYQALSGKKGEDGLHFRGAWDEFCGLLGWTPQHANEAIENLRSFGEEALESMSRMGIGYREMRQYRRLPDDKKQALIEVAKTGDKESFVDLAEEIIARELKAREALQKQLDQATQDHKATEKRLEATIKMRDRAEAEASRIAALPPDEKRAELKIEATKQAAGASGYVQGHLRQALIALSHEDEDLTVFMAGLVGQVVRQLAALREEFHLPDLSDAAEAEIAATVAKLAPQFKGGRK